MEKILYTTISTSYVPSWTDEQALVEILQNAHDAGKVNVSYTSGMAMISDNGKGILLRHLLTGVSEKSSEHSMGMFGEGLKLAALCFARSGKEMRIYSEDVVYKPMIILHPDFDEQVLAFEVGPATVSRTGTLVMVECNEADFDKAKGHFEQWSTCNWINQEHTVSLPGGRIFVNGIRCLDNDDLFFSYHIRMSTKDVINIVGRDRQMLDIFNEQVMQAMANAIVTIEDVYKAQILQRLEKEETQYGYSACIEANLPVQLNDDWARALRSVYKKPILVNDMHEVSIIENTPYAPVYLPYRWKIGFYSTDIETIDSMRKEIADALCRGQEPDRIQQEKINLAKLIIRPIISDIDNVKILVWENANVKDIFGAADDDIIYIGREVFDDIGALTKTILHERAHLEPDNPPDCTRRFEEVLLDYAHRALLLLANSGISS